MYKPLVRSHLDYCDIIKHLSKYLPVKTLNQMYKPLVRSHLDYCDIIKQLSKYLPVKTLNQMYKPVKTCISVLILIIVI